MLTVLPFGSLPQAEAIRFLEQFSRVVRSGGTLSQTLTEALGDLDAAVQQALQAFRKATGSEKTEFLQQLEAERDRLLTGIGAICRGQLANPDKAFAAAAGKLLANLQLYGGAPRIARMTVSAETTTIQELLSDWTSQPELANAVATLGLQGFAARLATVNTEYDAGSVNRTQELAERDTQVYFTVKDKLEEARPRYEEVVLLLNAGLLAARRANANAEAWLATVNAAQAITDEYEALRARRKTQRESRKNAPEQGQPA